MPEPPRKPPTIEARYTPEVSLGIASPRPEGDRPHTTLEKWAIALRSMAVVWWIGGVIVMGLDAAAVSHVGAPGVLLARTILSELFFTALGGILLYAFSYVLIGVECVVENTAITAEAALISLDEKDTKSTP